MEIAVVLHNIRSTYNVGAILRTCEGLGAERVILSGYTPRVHDPDLLPHLRDKIVGLENNIENVPIYALNDPELKEKLTDKIVLVLGEEVGGIDYSLYDIIDLFVEIPMRGKKESFNVSVAAGIALYGLIC